MKSPVVMSRLAGVMLIITFLLVLQNSSEAQVSFLNVKVNGQAVDSIEQKSIPFATVTLLKLPAKSVVKKIATSDDGKFEISVGSLGDYILNITSLGFNEKSVLLNIKPEHTSMNLGKIILNPSTTVLSAVQVTAEKPLIKVDADKLSYNAESDPDQKTSTALDMMRKVPLITVDGEDNIQLKGSSNYKIFMNGKPSSMLTNNAKDFLKNLPANMIKNIEVITSPGAKYDAEGIGGIINIVTLKRTSDGYSGTVNAGTNTIGSVVGGFYIAATIGKFGFSTNLSTSYQNNPYLNNNSFRESFSASEYKYSTWDGKSKYNAFFPFGNGELSYEIDTLNLISGSFNLMSGVMKNINETMVNAMDISQIINQTYFMKTKSTFSVGMPEGNLDYQHTFKKNKEQLLTMSYKINYNPTSTESESSIDNILNYYTTRQISKNDAYLAEHTFQTDYVQPINKTNKLELGLKHILRKNISNTDVSEYDFNSGQFLENLNKKNDFDYTQNITSGYLSYNLKFKKFGFKAGLRVENCSSNGGFTSTEYSDFKNSNIEFVPSANISYQIKPTQSMRLSYNLRIQRPGIWYLNPYVNDLDPKNIFYGNPKLDPERYHNFELNYSRFGQSGNFNLSTYYSLSNNAIDRYSWEENGGVIKSTYGNIKKINTYGLSGYASIKLGKKINFSMNASANYNQIKSNLQDNVSADGWGLNGFANIQYTAKYGIKATLSGNVYKPAVNLQFKMSPFYFTGLSLAKEFFKGKMSMSMTARNIFWKEMEFKSELFDSNFYQKNQRYRLGRSFGINFTYKFGEMKDQIKKAKRGINNDDLKKGEDGNGSNNG